MARICYSDKLFKAMETYLQAKATSKDGSLGFVFQYELLHVSRPQDYVESSRLSNICKELAAALAE